MLPSPEMILTALLYGLAIPWCVVMTGLSLSPRWGKLREGVPYRSEAIGDGLAVIAGLVVGFDALARTGQFGWEYLKPTDSWHWLPALAILATGAGILERMAAWPYNGAWIIRALTVAFAAWTIQQAEATIQPVSRWWIGTLGLAMLALWGLLDQAAREWRSAWFPALLAFGGWVAALVLELAAIHKFALMAAVLMSILIGCATATRRFVDKRAIVAAIPAFAVMLPGLLFAGYFNTYSGVPWYGFLLTLAAPLVLGAVTWLWSKKAAGWLMIVLAGLAAVAAIVSEWSSLAAAEY